MNRTGLAIELDSLVFSFRIEFGWQIILASLLQYALCPLMNQLSTCWKLSRHLLIFGHNQLLGYFGVHRVLAYIKQGEIRHWVVCKWWMQDLTTCLAYTAVCSICLVIDILDHWVPKVRAIIGVNLTASFVEFRWFRVSTSLGLFLLSSTGRHTCLVRVKFLRSHSSKSLLKYDI